MTKAKRTAVLRMLMLIGIFALGITLRPVPNCPTEDSCRVDYRNGGWYLQQESHGVPTGSWYRVSK